MRTAFCIAIVLSCVPLLAQEDLQPGLVGQYRSVKGSSSVLRIDRAISFDWTGARPDFTLPDGEYWVTWQGQLLIQGTGNYRFYAYLAGTLQVWLDDRPVLTATRRAPGWVQGTAVRLDLGFTPIRISYTPARRHAVLKLAWESEHFLLEPLPGRNLFHEGDEALWEMQRRRELGQELVRALRCAACHEIPGLDRPLKAPALDRSLFGVRPEWLAAWLHSPRAVRPDARMPEFGLSEQEASALATFLRARIRAPDASAERVQGVSAEGRRLFVLRGCAACHSAGDVGRSGPFGGGSLEGIGSKRSVQSLLLLLQDPAQVNPDHRMPRVPLQRKETAHLAAYLRSLRRPLPRVTIDDGDTGHASRLIEYFRCAACHRMEGFAPPDRLPLSSNWDVADSCLAEPDPDRGRPGFRLGKEQAVAVALFLRQAKAASGSVAAAERGRWVWRENNCTACHRRDAQGGYTERLDQGTLQTLGLSEQLRRGELSPPDLSGVGDKFRPGILEQFIHGKGPRRRPWLTLQMPAFPLDQQDRSDLMAFLRTTDRLPGPVPTSALRQSLARLDDLTPAEAVPAARVLIGSRGFGCMACHTIAGRKPAGADPEARGPELVGTPGLLRKEWFVRWLREPTRISLGVEMPGIQLPVRSVLAGDLQRQIAALWTAFAQPSFEPPDRVGVVVQIVSPRKERRTLVLRDCMRDAPRGSGWCPRAFAIGFPAGVNVLIDLDTYTVRSLWLGDLGLELTEHKTWLWEPAGVQLWKHLPRFPSAGVLRGNKPVLPERRGQSVGALRFWEHTRTQQVTYGYRLYLPGQKEVGLNESWSVAESGPKRTLIRTLRMVKADRPVAIVDAKLVASVRGRRLAINTPLGTLEVLSDGTPWQQGAADEGKFWWTGQASNRDTLTLQYRLPPANLELIARSLPEAQPVTTRDQPELLPWVPGYRTVRLALDDSVLPTCIGFLADGSPVVGSLRGGVFHARDTDGDGYPDRWRRYADILAAPFGMHVEKDGIVVAHKPELVRLRDQDADGFAERVDVIATGWGYTHDYHDWTFGVIRDREGRYIVALGSDYQQRGRPRAASRFRGKALRIDPSGKVEVLARGLRFPTGLAANHRGDVFFTDNQGVQNTFNELNHLIPRSRYGVPSLYDPDPAADPWPLRQPAVQIPHPWTRSVNGIAFLIDAQQRFGQHYGHLVGCEYDTRRLIRFTLYRVGDTYRGACYPLSLDPDRQQPVMLAAWHQLLRRRPSVRPARREQLAPLGPVSCAVRPDGTLFVGSLRESGWGAGNNVGELLLLEPEGELPPGIVEARFDGHHLLVSFSRPVAPTAAMDRGNYRLSSYTRIWKGSYATPDSDRRKERLRSIEITGEGRTVALELAEVRPDYVYELFVSPVVLGAQRLWPAEAYLTAPPEQMH